MREHAPALIVIVPLTIAMLAPLFARFSSVLARVFVAAGLFYSTWNAVVVLFHVLETGPWLYEFGGWAPPWGIAYVLDTLNSVIAVMITFISAVVVIFSREFLRHDNWLRQGAFYTLYSLLVAGLLGMVTTGDAFNLYVFLEISSLAGYALIAMGGQRGTVAALRYLMIGTIGATFYLLGIGYLYAITGTLNMMDLSVRLQPLMDTPPVMLSIVLIFVGMGIKMGLFPLHFWLPDAYTFAYPAATPFIAATMTKVSAYVMFRFYDYIFVGNSAHVLQALEVAGVLAGIGIIVGSVMAIAQRDFRRMLAYSSVAQIGYIVVGFAIGNVYAIIGAMFHIINHALMKGALFLIAGSVKLKYGQTRIEAYKDLFKKMPLTMYSFLILAFSMIGIPPTAGFFSKWYLVLGALEKQMWFFIVVIVFSSILNAVYFFRIIEFAFIREAKEELVSRLESRFELPLTMLGPILVMSLLVLVLGIFNEELVSSVLFYALPEVVLP